jgi:TBC1 domain family member 20
MEESTEPVLDEKTVGHNGTADAADKKREAILEACGQRDLGALRALAESPGGFLTDDIRQQACKLLTYLCSKTYQHRGP